MKHLPWEIDRNSSPGLDLPHKGRFFQSRKQRASPGI